jgi:hypothetical protein
MYQASVLNSEQNHVDECLTCMMETLNVQDLDSIKLIMDSLAQIHSEKVTCGEIHEDMLAPNMPFFKSIFTDD